MAETVQITGLDEVIRDLAKIGRPDYMRRMNAEIGVQCAELTGDHIMKKVSPTHHKVADRLKVPTGNRTGFFEFAKGRMGEFAGGKGGFIKSKDADGHGVTVEIGNTPGMSRAFHDLHIQAKNAPYLTIPIHADAYGKRAKDVRKVHSGIRLFRVTSKRGRLLLMGSEKSGGKWNVRPLYALVKSVTVPKDETLLPTVEEYQAAAIEAAEAFRDVETL